MVCVGFNSILYIFTGKKTTFLAMNEYILCEYNKMDEIPKIFLELFGWACLFFTRYKLFHLNITIGF